MAASNSLNMDESGVQTFNISTGNLTGSTTTQYNVIVGDTNNKLANVVPSATAGVPFISQGSSSNETFGTAVVAGGGTGNTTFTAYSVICAGTTATGAFQNVSGLGSAGQVLTSSGASALPTWQPAAGGGKGYIITTNSPIISTMSDVVIYQLADGINFSTSVDGNTRLNIPITGTINKIIGTAVFGTPGQAGTTAILSVLRNNSSTTNLTTSYSLSANPSNFTFTSVGIAVTAGDYINLQIAPNTYGGLTPPSNINMSATIYITVP